MKTEYIKYSELLKRENHLRSLKENGFKILYRKNRFKQIIGFSCLVVAIIPNGTGIFLYPLGFYLLRIGLKDILVFKDNLKFKVWLGFNK